MMKMVHCLTISLTFCAQNAEDNRFRLRHAVDEKSRGRRKGAVTRLISARAAYISNPEVNACVFENHIDSLKASFCKTRSQVLTKGQYITTETLVEVMSTVKA